jgi:uncharacterized protein involved in response to NO
MSGPAVGSGTSWLRLGFRPFFLAAGGYAVVSILIWFLSYSLGRELPLAGLSPLSWHAHEMIFGYSLAVIAGFLLTAVQNWTGLHTTCGRPLLLMFLFWLMARLLLVVGNASWLPAAAGFDIMFAGMLIVGIAVPVVRARKWEQMAIVLKVGLLLVSNVVFYLGVTGKQDQWVYWGLYSGLYLVLALILTLSRRLLPFFIERGAGYPVKLRNSKLVDVSGLFLFLALWIADMVQPNGLGVAVLAVLLAILHAWRLAGWYTPGIWGKPLLWVLYVAYAALVVGFVLKALAYFAGLSPYIAIHAFSIGGIGMMTLGMMTRVGLAHTGRNVFTPPPQLAWIFVLLFISFVVRVFAPLQLPQYYSSLISISQWLWITAFSVFLLLYLPMLVQPRVDGRDG